MSPADAKMPYPDCVGHVRGVWVRVIRGRVHLGIDYARTKAETEELARPLTEAAKRLGS